MNRSRGIAVGVVLLLLAASNVWAQATAQINGSVADNSGAVLPGVTIVAIQTDTGFRREAVSNDQGAYGLLNLPIGPYRLEASLAGFRSYVQTGIVLQVGSNPVIKVTLQLGQLAETVTVSGQAPLVETRNPAVGAVLTNAQVEALPMEGRNVASLVVTAGAAVDTGNPSSRSLTQTRAIAVAGGQQFGIAYLLDGALHNNVYDGDNLPLPFPDAVQEFKIETSSQNAQNGYKAGGTATFATKAGTNSFHGDVFEFARNHRFNATSPFAAINKQTGKRFDDGLVRNQFGGVLGGPIVKDRIFFFAGYQGSRSTQTPADIVTFIPTPAMLNGDFSAIASAQCRTQGNLTLPASLGFVNNQINPALLSPAAVKIAKMLPTTTDPCGQVAYSQTTKPVEHQPIVRLDVQLNQKHQLFGRYMLSTTQWDPAFANSNNNILSAAGTGAGGRNNKQQSIAIGDTYVFSPNVVNSARLFIDRTQIIRTNADMFGPEDIGIKNMYSYIPHYMNITTTGAFSVNTGTETYSFYKPNTTGISDDLTNVRGAHQFGFGAATSWSRWNTQSNVIQRRGDRPAARGFPARQGVRVPPVRAVRPGHHAALHRDLRAGHVARVVQAHAELRPALGTMVPAGEPGPLRLQLRYQPDEGGDPQHGASAGVPGPVLPRRSRFPHQGRHETAMDKYGTARGAVVGSKRRRQDVSARGLRRHQ
jgi:hypothetical protein